MDHLLYLIDVKDNIQTDYVVDKKEFLKIIDEFKEEIDKKVNEEYGMVKHIEIKKEKEDNIITYENLMDAAKLNKNE